MPRYSEHEWTTVLYAPLWVFEEVAGADGHISRSEWGALFDACRSARNYRNDLSREIFSELANNSEELLNAFDDDEDASAGRGLSEVHRILHENEESEIAYGFKADMIMVAMEVATANGHMGEDEEDAIDHVARALRVDPDDLEDLYDAFN